MDVTGTRRGCSVRSLTPSSSASSARGMSSSPSGSAMCRRLCLVYFFRMGLLRGRQRLRRDRSRTSPMVCFHRKYEGLNVAPESPPWASDSLPRAVPRKAALSAFELDRLGHRFACVLDQRADALDRRPLRIVEQMRIAGGGAGLRDRAARRSAASSRRCSPAGGIAVAEIVDAQPGDPGRLETWPSLLDSPMARPWWGKTYSGSRLGCSRACSSRIRSATAAPERRAARRGRCVASRCDRACSRRRW